MYNELKHYPNRKSWHIDNKVKKETITKLKQKILIQEKKIHEVFTNKNLAITKLLNETSLTRVTSYELTSKGNISCLTGELSSCHCLTGKK